MIDDVVLLLGSVCHIGSVLQRYDTSVAELFVSGMAAPTTQTVDETRRLRKLWQ